MRKRVLRTLVSCALIALWICSGCTGRRETEAPTHEIVRAFEAADAPLSVTLKIDRAEISIADSFHCVLELKRGTQLEAALPAFAELEQSFTPLLARDHRSLPRRIEDGHVIEGDEYELEPLVSGPVTIAPITVTYTVDGAEHTLTTEPIELNVVSLGADDPRAALRDIAGPVELKRPRRAWLLWLIVGASVCAAATVVLLLLRRRAQPTTAPTLRAAHEIAFDALRALREKDYIGQGLIQAFYIELSAILRWYIEHRFGLHAPEQTTEEFLSQIARNGAFDLRRRTLLQDFLAHCDLVKFARYGPTPDEITNAFDSAATFVDETKEQSTPDGV